MRIIVTLLASILSLSVYAADKDGNYAVWGPGEKSCYSYMKAREADNYDDYKHFIMGYLTAYNTLTEETFRISGDKNMSQILEWVDSYCEPKGVHGFEQAVTNFIIEHHETRQAQARSQLRR